MRAQDVHMAAVIDPRKRMVLMTGAIDQNEQNIVAKIELPFGGLWTFVKAETNLTEEPWVLWQITLGDGFEVPDNSYDHYFAARQFGKVRLQKEAGTITFYDGEVRPGEPVLKIFTVEAKGRGLGKMILGEASHSRIAGAISEKELDEVLESGLLNHESSIEITIATKELD